MPGVGLDGREPLVGEALPLQSVRRERGRLRRGAAPNVVEVEDGDAVALGLARGGGHENAAQ